MPLSGEWLRRGRLLEGRRVCGRSMIVLDAWNGWGEKARSGTGMGQAVKNLRKLFNLCVMVDFGEWREMGVDCGCGVAGLRGDLRRP